MERKEEENIKSLRMAAELSKDVVDKQWNSIDSLIQRSALVITGIGIFFGFLLQIQVGKDRGEWCLYFLSMLSLSLSFLFALYSFKPLNVAAGTKIEDLENFSKRKKKIF